MKKIEKSKTLTIQLIVRIAIFLVFLLGVFMKIPSYLLYLFLLLIIANIVLGFMNKRRNLVTNIVFLIMYPLLYVIIIEYLVILIGTIVSFVHALRFYLYYQKEK
jgi:hypothetical protein